MAGHKKGRPETPGIEGESSAYEAYKKEMSEAVVGKVSKKFRRKIELQALGGLGQESEKADTAVRDIMNQLMWSYEGEFSAKDALLKLQPPESGGPTGKSGVESRFIPVLEKAQHNGEMARASVEMLAEEKMLRIIEVIESELTSGKDREIALKCIKENFPLLSIKALTQSHYHGSEKQQVIVDGLPLGDLPSGRSDNKDSGQMPLWLAKSLQEYNEIELFERMVFPEEKNEHAMARNKIITDQFFRIKTGEPSFGQTDLQTSLIEESVGQNGFSMEINELPEGVKLKKSKNLGELPSRLSVNHDLLIRAEATAQLLKEGGLYNHNEQETIDKMIKELAAYDPETSYSPSEERAKTSEWKGKVGQRMEANGYEIQRVSEQAKDEKRKAVEAARKQQEAEAQIRRLEGELAEAVEKVNAGRQELRKQTSRAADAESRVEEVEGSLDETEGELKGLKEALGEIKKQASAGIKDAAKITGLFSGGKRADALNRLLIKLIENLGKLE